MWKAVGSVRFPMDAREVYEAILRTGDSGPVAHLSANGVQFVCRPRPGGTQAGRCCVLLEISLTMQPVAAVHYGLMRVPDPAIGEGVQSLHMDMVVARLVITQLEPGSSEGVAELIPFLGLPDGSAHGLATLAVQHVTGSVFHGLCEPLLRGLVAEGDAGLTLRDGWPFHGEIAGQPGPDGLWRPAEGIAPDGAPPRIITAPCPGRPRGWEDDWAHVQVDLLGRDPKEVYREWLALMPAERRARLKDSWASFKSALRYRRRKSAATRHNGQEKGKN